MAGQASPPGVPSTLLFPDSHRVLGTSSGFHLQVHLEGKGVSVGSLWPQPS